MSARRSSEHQRAVQELRRCNAAVPKPARKLRRQSTRAARRRKAVAEGLRA